MSNTFYSQIRDKNPCRDCPKKSQRPACRKGCEKDDAWHKELERIKANKRDYERQLGVRIKRK